MTTRTASCSCGNVTVTCAGEPAKVSLCHCTECQRRTGSAFGIAAFFAREAVAASGRTNTFRRPADSGFDVVFHFCPQCGGTVWWEPGRMPDLVAVAAGAFADPDFPAPSQVVYGRHRHRWVRLPDIEERN